MKTYAPKRTIKARHIRVPAFCPVPVRARADGWTPERQAAFLAALAQSGSVDAAARRVGMARETAYRLRRKAGAESFAATWDALVGCAAAAKAKVTNEGLRARALDGLLKPVIYAGRHVTTVRKADNSALLRYLDQLDRAGFRGDPGGGRSQSFDTLRAASTDPE